MSNTIKKEKDIHPKDNNNNYVYPTLKRVYSDLVIPYSTYIEDLEAKGISKSRAKEVVSGLKNHIKDSFVKVDVHYMNKRSKKLSNMTSDEQKEYIAKEKVKIKEFNFSKELGNLDISKLPLSLIKYKYELSLLK